MSPTLTNLFSKDEQTIAWNKTTVRTLRLLLN